MRFTHTSRHGTLSAVLSVLLLAVCIMFTSCLSSPGKLLDMLDSPVGGAIADSIKSIDEASEEITPENEYYIGRSVAAAITSKYAVYKDAPQMTAYLNAICGAITMNSDMPFLYRNYCVVIMDTDEINAMATPGGHIFISRGLINACNSEDELAAVIAHEIAHIQLKHSISAIKTSRISGAVAQSLKATAMIGAVVANDRLEQKTGISLSDNEMQVVLEATASFSDITNEIAEKLINSGFSKSQEYDADEKALTLMADAGYDPRAMLDMLSAIPTGGNHGWDATHPSPKDRIKKVNNALSDMDEDGLLPAVNSSALAIRQARFNANSLN